MKPTLLLIAALLASASALSVHGAPLRWAAQNDVLTLDPHSQNHSTTTGLLAHAYEGLTRMDAKYEPEPALATKWTMVSPTLWRFELRKGVKFHDGSPFTADDVVFSHTRVMQPQGNMQIYVTGIKEVKKIDSHTVDLVLSAPTPLLLRNLPNFRIMSKAWAEKNKAQNTQDYKAKEDSYASRNAMGTGPYKITSWQPDQKMAMVANEDWWDIKNRGNVTEISYLPIKSDPTRVAALLSGDVDLLTDLPTQDVAKLRTDTRLKVIDGAENRTIFIAMDLGQRRAQGRQHQGQQPVQGQAGPRSAVHRHRPRGHQAHHHARLLDSGRTDGAAQRQWQHARHRHAAQGRPGARQGAAGRGRLWRGL